MILRNAYLFIPILLLMHDEILGQPSPITFGVIPRPDLEMTVYEPDKDAGAVVLCDYCKAEMSLNNGVKTSIKRHVRIKILKKSGYDYGNVEIPYSTYDDLINYKASTCNIENGEPVETVLPKKQMIREKTSAYTNTLKIAFPQVREGSVIEYQYELITSDYFEFVPWTFEFTIPTIYSEFRASYPAYFEYKITLSGEQQKISRHYKSERFSAAGMSGTQHEYQWIARDLPAFEEEPYLPNIQDYLTGVRFELSAIYYPGGGSYEVSPTYEKISERLMEDEEFGVPINHAMTFSKVIKTLISGKNSQMEKALTIYDHIKTHMHWNDEEELYVSKPIKRSYNEQYGNSADINLMMINMMRAAGIQADPVILSTRENGIMNPVVALLRNINYVICAIQIDGNQYLLDGTDPVNPFGSLPLRCMNFRGWKVTSNGGKWIELRNNEINSVSTTCSLSPSDDGTMSAEVKIRYDSYSAQNARKAIRLYGEDDYKEDLSYRWGNIDVSTVSISGTDSLDGSLGLRFNAVIHHNLLKDSNLIIFNPYEIFENPSNPFIKEHRDYPVNFGCPIREEYTFYIEVPEGYSVDESPKKVQLILPNKDASFMQSTTVQNNILVINARFSIQKTFFSKDEYESLRQLYLIMLRKKAEMIVLRKNLVIS